MEKYIIAIAIVLSTIIYVFGNRYSPVIASEGINPLCTIDKFTGEYKSPTQKK